MPKTRARRPRKADTETEPFGVIIAAALTGVGLYGLYGLFMMGLNIHALMTGGKVSTDKPPVSGIEECIARRYRQSDSATVSRLRREGKPNAAEALEANSKAYARQICREDAGLPSERAIFKVPDPD